MKQSFKIVSQITEIKIVAVNTSIRELERLEQQYGQGRWRKLKGVAMIELSSGRIRRAEIHWYEAHGIGRKEFKRKHFLD